MPEGTQCAATREAVLELGQGACPLCERPASAHASERTDEERAEAANSSTIACRAKVVDDCYDGRPASVQVGEDGTLDEDGTFDGETIVCDACYLAVQPFSRSGRALLEELPEAIGHYRVNSNWARKHENPEALLEEVEDVLANGGNGGGPVRVDSPKYRSALGCKAIAEAEIARRAAS